LRYLNVDTITFTDVNNNSYRVKEIRDIISEPISFELNINKGDFLDEIASRKDIYGNYGESETYRIFDANIVRLTEVNFDLTKVRSVKIPL